MLGEASEEDETSVTPFTQVSGKRPRINSLRSEKIRERTAAA